MKLTAPQDDDLSPSHPSGRERRGIQSIEVGGEILRVLASEPRPMALRDLTKAVSMPSGKIHPYLVSFGKIGLVAQDPVTGQYLLGPMAIQLGLTGLQTLNPIREATPMAEALAAETGHTVAIAVWGNLGPVIVRLIDAAYPINTNIRTGTVMSLANTATGRVYSAYLQRPLIDRMLQDDYIRLGPDIAHPLDGKAVEDLIEEVRARGMSRGVNHPTPGIVSFSAPVFDYSGAIALTITMMGPTGTFDPDWNGPMAVALRTCALAISQRLGFRKA
ncbi:MULTISPECIES: IclR family transcriptional regulator [unclassified Acidovorax]|uniref:IclR family transcriptional regulator n=3 Tax=Acidovorax TaxID=12916 RepID=UPI001C445ED1|nr:MULTISPECIES: IclR family transcriptional regulator [unclassified Acidovorax]MBV7428355.1 IclR family transcriptional regulator [Acidovorax sp. sif0732]MBV7449611.1 IclR family transcriptional regulator [Acidovorax sp. sif0715]